MRGFRDQNVLFVIGVAVSFLAFLLTVIGMATTRWTARSNPDIEYGIFRYCVGGSCSYYSNRNSDLEASQALTIIGAIFAVVSFIVGCSHVILIMFRRYYEEVAAAASVCAGLSFLSTELAVIVWVATTHQDYRDVSSDYEVDWSLAISTVGGVLQAVSGVLMVVGRQ